MVRHKSPAHCPQVLPTRRTPHGAAHTPCAGRTCYCRHCRPLPQGGSRLNQRGLQRAKTCKGGGGPSWSPHHLPRLWPPPEKAAWSSQLLCTATHLPASVLGGHGVHTCDRLGGPGPSIGVSSSCPRVSMSLLTLTSPSIPALSPLTHCLYSSAATLSRHQRHQRQTQPWGSQPQRGHLGKTQQLLI